MGHTTKVVLQYLGGGNESRRKMNGCNPSSSQIPFWQPFWLLGSPEWAKTLEFCGRYFHLYGSRGWWHRRLLLSHDMFRCSLIGWARRGGRGGVSGSNKLVLVLV